MWWGGLRADPHALSGEEALLAARNRNTVGLQSSPVRQAYHYTECIMEGAGGGRSIRRKFCTNNTKEIPECEAAESSNAP